tara:strand:+ start:1194 stop:2213 length:1020 start_codon:yes stop_codon:yes gene_type:complete
MFFNQFPKTQYSIENNAIQSVITDYFRYVDVIDRLAQNTYAYSVVDILDSERPDTLSYRLYGTPDYYWTFFITNDSLKDGIQAWPKGDSEIKNYLANQYKNISAFRFPFGQLDSNGNRSTILGIPIKNESYLPYLRLCKILANEGQTNQVFSSAKIVDYDPNKSLIWIDNSDITWFSDDDALNSQVGSGTSLDKSYSLRSQTNMFYDEASADFTVQFISDGTTQADILRNAFINELRITVERFKPNSSSELVVDADLDSTYTITSTQFWKDGSLAPAYYYDPVNINEEISEFNAGPEATNYESIYDEAIEENDERRQIKATAPQHIESFIREFKNLLNE